MAIDNILAKLAGRDSKNPMGFDDLLAASGIDATVLESVLHQLCHQLPAPINCAQITRAGKTQMFYWPTGVVEKAERQDITINPKKRPTFPAPRRSEIMPAKPKQETPMQAKEGKSNARVMLEYLAEHGTATGQELCQLCGVESVGAFLKGPISRSQLQVEQLGQTSRSGNRYTVAPGVTPEQLLADGRKKNVPPHRQPASEKPSIPAEPAPFEIPVIVAQPAGEIVQPETEILPVTEDAPQPAKEHQEPTALEWQCMIDQVYIDATGRLVIQQPGAFRFVFKASDTIRIQKLLMVIDLELLCA